MKNIFITLLIIISGFTLKAQSVNGIELKDLDVNYMRVYGRTNFLGNKMVVRFEFGQRIGFDHNNKNIRDEKGRILKFNTMIDALNFISSYGYRLVQSYMTASGRTIYYHYIVEKIGLIDNKGVNKYKNSQNTNYNRTYGSESDLDNYKEQKKAKKEEWKNNENDKVVEKEKSETKTKKKEPKEKSSFLKSLDKLTNKIEGKEQKEEVKTEPKKPSTISCSKCNGSGKLSTDCSEQSCKKGTIQETCTVCNGNYKEGKEMCFRCEGEGCDYCNYNGTACDSCVKGQKTHKHNTCNGTGVISNPCNNCKGTGKIVE